MGQWEFTMMLDKLTDHMDTKGQQGFFFTFTMSPEGEPSSHEFLKSCWDDFLRAMKRSNILFDFVRYTACNPDDPSRRLHLHGFLLPHEGPALAAPILGPQEALERAIVGPRASTIRFGEQWNIQPIGNTRHDRVNVVTYAVENALGYAESFRFERSPKNLRPVNCSPSISRERKARYGPQAIH